MAVSWSEVKTSRKPLSKKWWMWALVGIFLFLWLDACAAEKLEQLEEAFQAEEQKVLVFAAHPSHADAPQVNSRSQIE